jgi:transposase
LNAVEEVTLDMSGSMHNILRYSFPKAQRVIDRFHVQELAFDAVQQIRIAHRWDAINEETEKREKAKLENKKHKEILNFFVNLLTNASTESFNAKIKSFRTAFRGLTDINFFLFRLSKIYA